MQIKRFFGLFNLFFLLFFVSAPKIVLSADSTYKNKVVINEVAFAGSVDDSNDEWIELYNDSDQEIDLSGWKIIDNASEYLISIGKIQAKSFFLIEDKEEAVSTVKADAVIGLSLANTGEMLELKDALGNSVDIVNALKGPWHAGDATSKATMERKAVLGPDDKSNWQTAIIGNGEKASKGSSILGTPRGVNSNLQQTTVSNVLLDGKKELYNGDTVNITFKLDQIKDLFAYGFDIVYDPKVLQYEGAQKKTFLNNYGNDATSFQSSLLDNTPGRVIAAEARILTPKTAISGNGDLFDLTFKAIGQAGASTNVSLDGGKSFLAGLIKDIPFLTKPLEIKILDSVITVGPVIDLQIAEDTNRYGLKLTWKAPISGADNYKVFRKGIDSTYLDLGTVSATEFIDKDGVKFGGNIVPKLNYVYKVIAVKEGKESEVKEISGMETRGIKADITRNDRVDGRDLAELARVYDLDISSVDFNALADLNYDGRISGSDLLDLAADFARTYSL